jgi:ADP-ribose pyrophosphatase
MPTDPLLFQDWEHYLRLTGSDALGDTRVGEIRIVTDPDEAERIVRSCRSGAVAKHGEIADYRIGVVYADPYIAVVRDLVEFPTGAFGTYIRVLPLERPYFGVCVLPFHADRLVLMRQFRHASRRWHYELPKGMLNTGESPPTAASRELTEELNATAADLRYLGNVYADLGLLGRPLAVFTAQISAPARVGGDYRSAGIGAYSQEEIRTFIRNDEIDDGMTLAALQLYGAKTAIP